MKLFLISVLILPFNCIAQFQLARIFSNHMVLQREKPVPVWGKGLPGKKVSVSFANTVNATIVKADSSWIVYCISQKANRSPQSIIVTSDENKIELKNILIGDVWICSGQSNMEWPISKEKHWQEEKEHAEQPLIRFVNASPAGRYVYGVPYTDSLNRRLTKDSFYLWNGWKVCDSNTIKPMSAVGYYFAKTLATKENIPVGLINLSIGGAPLETFIDKAALKSSKQFSAKVNGDWLQNEALPDWVRQRAMQNVGMNKDGFGDETGLNHAYKPGFAYTAGIEQLLPMPVKGILFYQGESNSLEIERVNEYAALSKLMVDDYRKKWQQPNLPFYFAQLSSIDTIKYKGQLWPQIRDEQRKILQIIPYSGMAVCSDIGSKDDVHPTNKKDVGERLARWALNKIYHENIVPSGPLPIAAKYAKGKVVISFHYAVDRLRTSDANILKGFSLDGKNAVEASCNGNVVLINTKEKPTYVYYGWKPFSDGNLVNSEDLPASTFKIKVY